MYYNRILVIIQLFFKCCQEKQVPVPAYPLPAVHTLFYLNPISSHPCSCVVCGIKKAPAASGRCLLVQYSISVSLNCLRISLPPYIMRTMLTVFLVSSGSPLLCHGSSSHSRNRIGISLRARISFIIRCVCPAAVSGTSFRYIVYRFCLQYASAPLP